jgi:hypothetical protein
MLRHRSSSAAYTHNRSGKRVPHYTHGPINGHSSPPPLMHSASASLIQAIRLNLFLARALFEPNVRCPTSIVPSRPSRSRTLNVTAAPSQRAPSLKGLLSPGKKRYGGHCGLEADGVQRCPSIIGDRLCAPLTLGGCPCRGDENDEDQSRYHSTSWATRIFLPRPRDP